MRAVFRAALAAGRSLVVAACLLTAGVAWADDLAPGPLPPLGDVVHKGLVGKALDVVPMDPGERVVLQRTSAVVSGTLTGRSLAAWAGLSHPILLVAGLVWGIYSALSINVAGARTPDEHPIQPEPVALLASRERED